jgi:hypothetical protein
VWLDVWNELRCSVRMPLCLELEGSSSVRQLMKKLPDGPQVTGIRRAEPRLRVASGASPPPLFLFPTKLNLTFFGSEGLMTMLLGRANIYGRGK